MSKTKPILADLGGGLAQLGDGTIVDIEDHSVGYASEGSGLSRQPFSNWHPLSLYHWGLDSRWGKASGVTGGAGDLGDKYDLYNKHTELEGSNVIEWDYMEWETDGVYVYRFYPQGERQYWWCEIECDGLNVDIGNSGPWCMGVGLFAKSYKFSELAEYTDMQAPPFPPHEHFLYTVGEAFSGSAGYPLEEYSYVDVKELPDQHFEGPMNDDWWDYGPLIKSKVWFPSPRPAHNTRSFCGNFDNELIGTGISINFEMLRTTSDFAVEIYDFAHVLHEYDEDVYFDQGEPDIEDPPDGYETSHTTVGTYNYQETWNFFIREQNNGKPEDDPEYEEWEEYVLRVDYSSPTNLKYFRQANGTGFRTRPYKGYIEWRSKKPFSASFYIEDDEDHPNETVEKFEFELDGDPMTFTISWKHVCYWNYYTSFGGYWSKRVTTEDEQTMCSSSGKGFNWFRWLGFTFTPNNRIMAYKLMDINYKTKATPSVIAPAISVSDIIADQLVFESDGLSVVIYDIGNYYGRDGDRSTFMSEQGWQKEMHPKAYLSYGLYNFVTVSDVRLQYLEDLPHFKTPETRYDEEKEEDYWHGNFHHVFPPNPAWFNIARYEKDEFDPDGSFKMKPTGQLVVEVWKNQADYSRTVLYNDNFNKPDNLTELDTFDATLQIIPRSGAAIIRAGSGTIAEDSDDSAFDVVVELSGFGKFKVTDDEGLQNSFYSAGECKILHYEGVISNNATYVNYSYYKIQNGRTSLKLYPKDYVVGNRTGAVP